MRLLRWELRKLFTLPMVWVFLALCLALNGGITVSNAANAGGWDANTGGWDANAGSRAFFRDLSADAAALGQRINPDFLAGISALPRTANRAALLEAAGGLTDVFQTYDPAALSAHYESQVWKSPVMVRWIHAKYERIAERVAALAASGAGMDLYAGPLTHDSHQFLFAVLLRALTAEGVLLGSLAGIYLMSCENISHTAALLCASRAGRRQWRQKLAAGLLGTLLFWLLLAAGSLALYFALWDYGGIWTANVSSGFNYIQEILFVKPFLTWTDFSFLGYLLASLGMSLSLALVCCLLACAAGLWVQNAYLAAFLPAILGGAGLLAAVRLSEFGPLPAFAAACFQPVILWLDAGEWFTDGGTTTVLPWQEPITAALWLLLAALALLGAYKRFCGKDI